MLGIAYYNMGVQEEFLNRYDSCLEWYNKANSTILSNPLADPKLRDNFQRALQQAILKYKTICEQERALKKRPASAKDPKRKLPPHKKLRAMQTSHPPRFIVTAPPAG